MGELEDAKAKILELEAKQAKFDEVQAELEKQKGIVENAQALVKKQADETGDNRKAAVEASKALVTALEAKSKVEDNFAKVSAELAEAKKQGPKGTKEQSDDKDKTLDEIEAALTKDEAAKLDEAYKSASEELKQSIKSDDAIRRAFLSKAKAAVAADVEADLSDWRKKPAQKSSTPGGGDELDKLFNLKKKSASYHPDGPRSGPARPARRAESNPPPKPGWIESE